jgi:hypothetical protein
MDWWVWLLLIAVGIFFLIRNKKNEERAVEARATLKRDNALYQNIKAGIREYNFREREQRFWEAQDGQMLFETAHMIAYKVDHFAESRVGFYFKDLNEYGLYGFFAGNGDEFHESYYRSDKTFKVEGPLYYDYD